MTGDPEKIFPSVSDPSVSDPSTSDTPLPLAGEGRGVGGSSSYHHVDQLAGDDDDLLWLIAVQRFHNLGTGEGQ